MNTMAPPVGLSGDEVRSALESAGVDLSTVRSIPLGEIQPGRFQPRTEFDERELNELATSMRFGQVETAIVNRLGQNQYELLAGERRWRASKIAGRKTLRCAVVEIDDRKLLIGISLLSNGPRKEVGVADRLRFALRLRDEEEMSVSEIADAFGISVQGASNLLSLEHLHGKLLAKLGFDGPGGFSASVAQELIRLAPAQQMEAMKVIRKGGMGQKRARRVVDRMLAEGADSHPDRQDRTAATAAFQRYVAGTIGAARSALKSLTTSARAKKLDAMDAAPRAKMKSDLRAVRTALNDLVTAVGGID